MYQKSNKDTQDFNRFIRNEVKRKATSAATLPIGHMVVFNRDAMLVKLLNF